MAPCDRAIDPDQLELRVAGPGIRPSNPFRVAADHGTIRVSASAGQVATHDRGRALLVLGVPVGLAGTALLGVGRTQQAGDAVTVAGVAVIALGGAAILASLPLLVAGSTTVRDDQGKPIASGERPAPLF